jgi:hypothetical protein
MRTYGDVVGDLARAVAHLVSTTKTLPDAEATRTARTAVFDGIRHTVDALTGARTPPNHPQLADLELSPASAFRAALHHLPRTQGSIALTAVVADMRVDDPWVQAAAASLELTKYEERLSKLEIPAQWAALGDIAEVVVTLCQVDEDLKASFPTFPLPDRRARAALRLTAAAVHAEARHRPRNKDAESLSEPIPARPWPIRRAADIPIAMDRIAAMIRSRHAQITMHEIGGVLQPLARGLDDASQILKVTTWRLQQPDLVIELAARAERMRDALAAIGRHRGQVMTVGPIDRTLIEQAVELRGAMRSLLDYSGTIDGASNLGPARVSASLVAQSWTITSALTHALSAAAQAGQLLARNRGLDINSRSWTRALPYDDRVTTLLNDLRASSSIARPASVHQRVTDRVLGRLSPRAAQAVEGIRDRELSEAREIVRLTQR